MKSERQFTIFCIVMAISLAMAQSVAAQRPQTDTLVVGDRYAGSIALSVSAGDRFVAGRLTTSHGKLIGDMLFAGAGTGLTVGTERIHEAATTYSLEHYRRRRVVLLPLYVELRWHFPEIGRADLYMLSRIGVDFGLHNADAVGVDGMLGAGIGSGRISIALAYEHMRQRGMVTLMLVLDF